MSLLTPIAREELLRHYTHRGWFVGLVPVYVGDAETNCPLVTERNGVPECFLWWGLWLFHTFCMVASWLHEDFEPSYPIWMTGRIEP